MYNEVIELDEIYSFGANYNLAYAYLRRNYDGKKNHQPYINKAYEQLEMMQLMLGPKNNETALSRQITSKIALLNSFVNHSQHAMEYISKESDGKKLVTIKSYKLVQELFDPEAMPREEINELGRYGLYQIFEVEAKKSPRSWDVAIGVTALGIGQVVAGVVVATATAGAESQLAAHLIIDGAKDVYHGIRVGMGKESLSWQSYCTEKGISYACYFIVRGASSLSPGKKAAEEGAKQAAEQAAKEGVRQAVEQGVQRSVFHQVGVEIAKSLAFEGIMHVVMKTAVASALDNYKDDLEADALAKIVAALESPEIARAIRNILIMDTAKGTSSGQKAIMLVASNRMRTSKVAEVTKRIASSAASGYGGGVGTAFTAGSMALSARDALLAVDEFCVCLKRDILYIERELPTITNLLAQGMGSANNNEAEAIEKFLRAEGMLNGKYELAFERISNLSSGSSNDSSLGSSNFTPGISASSSNNNNSSKASGFTSGSNPLVLKDLSYAATNLGRMEQQKKDANLRALKQLAAQMQTAAAVDYSGARSSLAKSLS